MSEIHPENDPPVAELPPEARRVISQARRSFAVSIIILLVGFIAIAGALVYRATRDNGGPAERYGVETVGLPQGATLISATIGEGMITLCYRIGTRSEIRIVDGKTGAVAKTIAVTPE